MPWPGMPPDHREKKYLISADKALHAREFIQSYLPIVEYGVGRPDCSYPVQTVYLDAADLRLYDGLVTGHRNRMQLRMRCYTTMPSCGDRFYLEVKRWTDDQIVKERGAVRFAAVNGVLQGQLPGAEELVTDTPKGLRAVQDFTRLLEQIEATPKVVVSYDREGYANDSESVRINLDRHIEARRQRGNDLFADGQAAHPCFEGQVMLELKFVTRFPNWFRQLVEHFELVEYEASKYCAGMQAVGLASA